MKDRVKDMFDLTGKVAVITGGAGLLGTKHAEAIAEMGGIPILLDMDEEKLNEKAAYLREKYSAECDGILADITSKSQILSAVGQILEKYHEVDILVNNAALTVKRGSEKFKDYFASFEEYPLDLWEMALRVNLTGTFLVTQAIGKQMVKQGKGVILNIASDVGVISPDHRIYRKTADYKGMPFNTPISYSVSKAALIHFTKYLATYWADKNIRVNSLSPAGVYDGHDPEFVKKLTNLIPLGRMADRDEYKGAIVFLVSDASSFMTGANLIIDGGRTCW